MIGLYSLEFIILVILIILSIISFIVSLINLAFIFISDDVKKIIIKILYYASISFTIFILLELVSSVSRHLTDKCLSYDDYFNNICNIL